MRRPSDVREAAISMAAAAVVLVVTIFVAVRWGYGRAPESVGFVLGIPDWIFWGVLVPWALVTAFTGWFSLRHMKDEDLGVEEDEEGAP